MRLGTLTLVLTLALVSVAEARSGALWSYSGSDLWSGKAPVHINVWPFQGRPPAGGQDVEIVFRAFSYQP